MALFDPMVGAPRAWGVNEGIEQVDIPRPTNVNGELTYTFSGLPDGVEINLASLVLYGAPTSPGSGSFILEAADDDGAVTYTLPWTVVAYAESLTIAPFEDLRFFIGQQAYYQLPEPTGGVPPYTYEIVGPSQMDPPAADVRLPAGLTMSEGGLFSGTPTDTRDNNGAVFARFLAEVNITFEQGGTRERRNLQVQNPVEGSNSFVWDGNTYTFTRWLERGPRGGLTLPGDQRVQITGGLPTADPAIRNNPYLRVYQADDPEVEVRLYLSSSRPTTPQWTYFWERVGDQYTAPGGIFHGQQGRDFFVELRTDTTYPLTIRVSDSVGSAVDQEIEISTSRIAGRAAAPTLDAPVVTAHSVSVNLTDGHALPREYSLVPVGGQPAGWIQFAGDALEIASLRPSTGYSLWVRYIFQGPGPATLIRFTTLAAAGFATAPAPGGLAIEALNGALRGRWRPADVTTQALGVDYQVVADTEELDPDGWRIVPASTGATGVWTERGLRNGEAYKFAVRHRNDAGAGSHSVAVETPLDSAPPPDREFRNIQLQVMMDLAGPGDEPRGLPWFDLSNRVLSCHITSGREARQQLTATGVARFSLHTSDDFINVEGTSLYRIDDLRNREVYINEVLETPSGVRRRTRFAGLVEDAVFTTSGEYSEVAVTAVDVLGLLAQDEAVFGIDIPAELTGERFKNVLTTAGWSESGQGRRTFDPALIDEGTKTCASISVPPGEQVNYNLLDELNLIAQSEGGRLYVTGGGDNTPGGVRFEQSSPVIAADGIVAAEVSANPAVIRSGGTPVVESEDSFLYNDFELLYPDATEPARARDEISVGIWGKRTYDLYTEVRTDRDGTEALVRSLLRQYSRPRKWIRELPVSVHFQNHAGALILQDLDLSRSLQVEYRPPGGEAIVTLQRVDALDITYTKADRQFVRVDIVMSLLVPEATSYWVLEVEGSDRYDAMETILSPKRVDDPDLGLPSGRLVGGWRPTEDREYQVVSAHRASGYLFQQVPTTYSSIAERDEHENRPQDGHACVVVEQDPESKQWEYSLYEYDITARQWLRRAFIDVAAANPAQRTFIVGDATAGIIGFGSGNVLAAGDEITDLRSG